MTGAVERYRTNKPWATPCPITPTFDVQFAGVSTQTVRGCALSDQSAGTAATGAAPAGIGSSVQMLAGYWGPPNQYRRAPGSSVQMPAGYWGPTNQISIATPLGGHLLGRRCLATAPQTPSALSVQTGTVLGLARTSTAGRFVRCRSESVSPAGVSAPFRRKGAEHD